MRRRIVSRPAFNQSTLLISNPPFGLIKNGPKSDSNANEVASEHLTDSTPVIFSVRLNIPQTVPFTSKSYST